MAVATRFARDVCSYHYSQYFYFIGHFRMVGIFMKLRLKEKGNK